MKTVVWIVYGLTGWCHIVYFIFYSGSVLALVAICTHLVTLFEWVDIKIALTAIRVLQCPEEMDNIHGTTW